MLTIGDTFPAFSLTAVKGGPEGLKLDTAFTVEGLLLLAEGLHLHLPDRNRRLRQTERRLRRP